MSTNTIVLTGAGGHVGGAVFKALSASQIGHLRASFRQSIDLPDWATSLEIFVGDLAEPRTHDALLRGASTVLHLATSGYSSLAPASQPQLDDEVATAVALATSAAWQGVRRFIFVSSIHVYGQRLVGVVNEQTKPEPHTEYGQSRAAIENALSKLRQVTDMEIVVIRMSNAFGVPVFERPASWQLLVPDLCRQVVESGRLRLRSSGRSFRNLIALRDAAGVLCDLASRGSPLNGTYLLGGPQTLTLREVAEMVAEAASLSLGITPTVECGEDDMTKHERFELDLGSLRRLGVTIEDHRHAELHDLLHFAAARFNKQVT